MPEEERQKMIKDFLEALEPTVRWVESWPIWKQNIVRDSLSPTVPVAREPIIYDDGGW
jgi:hypothetical protein